MRCEGRCVGEDKSRLSHKGRESGWHVIKDKSANPHNALVIPSCLTSNVNHRERQYLKVEERTYYAVSATMHVLQLVIDYLKVIVNLTLMNTECMSRLVEFLKVRECAVHTRLR